MTCGCAWCPKSGDQGVKIKASVMSALLFVVIASPELFGVMQSLLGSLVRVASPAGVPTATGLVLHAVVFGLLVFALMQRKKKASSW